MRPRRPRAPVTSRGLVRVPRVRLASAGERLARPRTAWRSRARGARGGGGNPHQRPERGGAHAEPARAQVESASSLGKARAIDYAVEQLGIESFASLEFDGVFGERAFYTIDKPTVQHGALVDARARRARADLLSAIELAAERPGMRVLDRALSDPRTVSEIGEVDAILLFDVLHHMVDPDWDQVLDLYAPITSSIVIANPQRQRDETTVRLIDLGREQFLEAVPPTDTHAELFDRLDDWHKGQQRLYRDATDVWQWGVTDADLKAKLGERASRWSVSGRSAGPRKRRDSSTRRSCSAESAVAPQRAIARAARPDERLRDRYLDPLTGALTHTLDPPPTSIERSPVPGRRGIARERESRREPRLATVRADDESG